MGNNTKIAPEILQRIKQTLQETYGDRFKGVILYGSEARGEAEEDSDIDLLVLLDGEVKLWTDIRIIVKALYPIQLEVLRPIHATPANYRTYEAGEYFFYLNARNEGVLL
jgi:predicted nucleotidyltransferase